jgi:hypothetical protein
MSLHPAYHPAKQCPYLRHCSSGYSARVENIARELAVQGNALVRQPKVDYESRILGLDRNELGAYLREARCSSRPAVMSLSSSSNHQ